jgi:hypothetical protein
MTLLKDPRSSWLISLLFHGGILALLAFLMVRPVLQQKWYELKFWDDQRLEEFQRPNPPVEQVNREPGGTQAPGKGTRVEARMSVPVPTNVSNDVHQGYSELLETPALPRQNPKTQTYSVGNNPYAQNAISGILNGTPGNTGTVQFAVAGGGGRVHFRLPAGYKHNLGDSGSATVQFSLDRYARLIPGSVISLQQTEGRFFEAAKKALADGTFTIDGAPENNMVCQITLDFL